MIGKVTVNPKKEIPKSPTPGPWKVVKPAHGHKTEYLCVQIGEDESYTTLELLPADAILIAQAPKFLGACHLAFSLLDLRLALADISDEEKILCASLKDVISQATSVC